MVTYRYGHLSDTEEQGNMDTDIVQDMVALEQFDQN